MPLTNCRQLWGVEFWLASSFLRWSVYTDATTYLCVSDFGKTVRHLYTTSENCVTVSLMRTVQAVRFRSSYSIVESCTTMKCVKFKHSYTAGILKIDKEQGFFFPIFPGLLNPIHLLLWIKNTLAWTWYLLVLRLLIHPPLCSLCLSQRMTLRFRKSSGVLFNWFCS